MVLMSASWGKKPDNCSPASGDFISVCPCYSRVNEGAECLTLVPVTMELRI